MGLNTENITRQRAAFLSATHGSLSERDSSCDRAAKIFEFQSLHSSKAICLSLCIGNGAPIISSTCILYVIDERDL